MKIRRFVDNALAINERALPGTAAAIRHLAGERHEQHPARRAHRWGKEAGYCVVDGQKVPMERTRLRTPENREQRLGSYEMFQRSGPMEHAV